MSELMNTTAGRGNPHWRLLGTVSALALLTSACVTQARAEDTGAPTLWLELGGQLEHIAKAQYAVSAPFIDGPLPLPPSPRGASTGNEIPINNPGPFTAVSPLDAQKPPRFSFGGEARLVFHPKNADWQFTAAVRYGRSTGGRTIHHTTRVANYLPNPKYTRPDLWPDFFSDSRARIDESHVVLDFQAGRDVGLGLFGSNATSLVNFGVRFAQFTSKFSTKIGAVSNMHVYSPYNGGFASHKYGFRFQSYLLKAGSERSFHGIGPSLSWNGSTPLAGNPDREELAFEWGVNAAVLFGHQKVDEFHETADYDRYFHDRELTGGEPIFTLYHNRVANVRSHAVVVPNIGGLAGIALKFPSAKVSFGYRADFYFGALDGGLDVRQAREVSFHGPFARISVGLGG